MNNIFKTDPVPLSWVGGSKGTPNYINVGDALSPYLVSMVSGRPMMKANSKSQKRRMGAIGTIGQSFVGGEVDIWGTGCSPWANPLEANKRVYEVPAGTKFNIHASRGPMSSRLLSGGTAAPHPFGDPAVLLPRFYNPKIAKKHEIGVVLHLSELEDRAFTAHAKPVLRRYDVPAELADDVHLITMVADDSLMGVKGKLDEMLSCKRIVSTSLHGFAIAAAYEIPCLYLGADAGPTGMAEINIDDADHDRVNARFVDLYGGYGQSKLSYYRQARREATDWAALMKAVDHHSPYLKLDEDALMAACPAGANPLTAPKGKTIWDHPIISAVPVAAGATKPSKSSALNRLFGRAAAR